MALSRLLSTCVPRLAILLLAMVLPACATHLQKKESYLREAGFHAVTPVTPVQIARVKALPQGHITRVKHQGKVLFVLADARQNFVLIGGDPQYQRYQQILYKKEVIPGIGEDEELKAFDEAGGPLDGLYGPMGMFGGPMMMY